MSNLVETYRGHEIERTPSGAWLTVWLDTQYKADTIEGARSWVDEYLEAERLEAERVEFAPGQYLRIREAFGLYETAIDEPGAEFILCPTSDVAETRNGAIYAHAFYHRETTR